MPYLTPQDRTEHFFFWTPPVHTSVFLVYFTYKHTALSFTFFTAPTSCSARNSRGEETVSFRSVSPTSSPVPTTLKVLSEYLMTDQEWERENETNTYWFPAVCQTQSQVLYIPITWPSPHSNTVINHIWKMEKSRLRERSQSRVWK